MSESCGGANRTLCRGHIARITWDILSRLRKCTYALGPELRFQEFGFAFRVWERCPNRRLHLIPLQIQV